MQQLRKRKKFAAKFKLQKHRGVRKWNFCLPKLRTEALARQLITANTTASSRAAPATATGGQRQASRMNNGFSTGEEDSRGGHTDQTCCLIDDNERCRNPAGYASYSKRIQKTVSQKRLKLSSDPTAQHIYICDYHKGRIQSARTKRRRKDSEDDSNETDTDLPDVPDLCQLQVNTLRRYKRHYKVQTRPGMKRAQLADTIMKHFKTIPIKEKEIITYFVYMVKSNSNKLDQKNGIGNDTT